jgi:hypothetical protein
LTLGKAGVAGSGPDEFNAPSAVLVAPNDDIFVADGHGGNTNARIVKFDPTGKFIKTWGRKGSGPGEFDGPHALAMDTRGRLFVGDRGNNRIQIFDQDGNFIDQWAQFSRPSGVYIDGNDIIYVADSESESVAKNHADWKRGMRIGSVRDGTVTALIPDPEQHATTGLRKTSASTGERSPGGRLDAGAARAQVPEQETRSFPLADDDRRETAADVGIDCPQCLGGFLRA